MTDVVVKPYTERDKLIVTLLSGLIFLVISSPFLYSITRQLYSGIASRDGLATMTGLLIHTVVFMIIVRLLMR